eukprot:scaffold498_cov291-Prasinococcus_capsulatus_cf.AAC.5
MSPEEERERVWVPYRRAKADAKLRLFLFHWQGGSAAYFCDWEHKFSDKIELCAVQLPGRENRRQEPRVPTLQAAAEQVVAALGHLMQDPAVKVALFGHAMGAWAAFEVAREMRRLGLPHPAQLFVSNWCAPQVRRKAPARRARSWPAWRMPKAEGERVDLMLACSLVRRRRGRSGRGCRTAR